ncbi:MAG: protein-glutamate O-methyltransferase CheR [Candidatus Omnitrophica bacterium]|nr:protein-glutamate O-methyltransferase CheR [Candidatus Omnitrophota bacterium]
MNSRGDVLPPDKANDLSDLPPVELAAFHQIVEMIFHIRGVDLRQYRKKSLRRRISIRMHQHRIEQFRDYAQLLAKNPAECDALLDKITINVTEFFRNPETYAAVRAEILPRLLEEKLKAGTNVFRVWSAGCASGEEPYSIAIMLRELFVGKYAHFLPHIYASDIDDHALAEAKAGVYQERSLRELSLPQREKYFTRQDAGLYSVRNDFRTIIRFVHQNMISDPPFRNIDLIYCRNVIIYFTRELQRKLYENFHAALTAGGYLVAGKVEAVLGITDGLFERVNPAEKIFRKM